MDIPVRVFKDIDLTFTPHPVTKDLLAKTNENAIKNAIKNLIMTRHYERPFHSEIGSSVTSMLFELPTPGLVAMLRQEIYDTIKNFEPRAVVLDVDVGFDPDNHFVLVTVVFKIVNTTRPIVVEFTLDRTR